MKKICFLLLALLCFVLCACQALQGEDIPDVKEVHITAGKITAGMTVKDVTVEVTVDGQPVACRAKLTGFAWDGYWEMAEDEPVRENSLVRLDVFYSLPKGYDVENVDITVVSDGGSYDGTGSISNDDDGNIEAWSRIFYGEEQLPPETEHIEQTQPTEVSTQPPQTVHTHTWVEQPGPGIIDCTLDREKISKCSCGETRSEIIPAPGHDMKDGAIQNPTCTDVGSQTKRCSRCGYAIVIESPAVGHTWSAWAHENGRVHKRTCTVCRAEETESHKIPSGGVVCTECGEAIIN